MGLADFIDENIRACANSHALKKIKRIFRANKSKQNYFDCNRFNIAMHVRGLRSDDCRILGTDIPDEFFLNAIQFLREKYKSEQPTFHIYSKGNVDEFQMKYEASDVVFHIGESIENEFASLVFADVLVTSQSCLSYTAGLLSEGIVYYTPFWYHPLPHWISYPLSSPSIQEETCIESELIDLPISSLPGVMTNPYRTGSFGLPLIVLNR